MSGLTVSDEKKLLESVKLATSLVDDSGLSPNEAMKRVVDKMSLTPGFLKSACSAFNTGRQLAQWSANPDILDKLASFPLADYDKIASEIWGEKTASEQFRSTSDSVRYQSHTDRYARQLATYQLPFKPTEKVAESLTPARSAVADAWQKYKSAEVSLSRVRQEKSAAEDRLNFSLHKLVDYFGKFACDRLPLAQVESAVVLKYGEAGKSLMDYVGSRYPREKRAADHSPRWVGFSAPVDYSAMPYSLVTEIVKQGQALVTSRMTLDKQAADFGRAKKAVEDLTRKINAQSFALAPDPDAEDEDDEEMSPLLLKTSADLIGSFKDTLAAIKDKADSSVQKQIEELDSVDHMNALRKIRAQTALTGMMSDPENPVSAHNPEEVLRAYNELIMLAPSMADQPAALQPLLQKRLSGYVEPFEIGETLKMEDTLRKTSPQSGFNLLKAQKEGSILFGV